MIVSLCVHPECRVNCGCWWWEHCFVTWLEWQQRTPDLGQHISTDWKHVTLARIGYMKPTMHPNTGVQQWRNDSRPQWKWHPGVHTGNYVFGGCKNCVRSDLNYFFHFYAVECDVIMMWVRCNVHHSLTWEFLLIRTCGLTKEPGGSGQTILWILMNTHLAMDFISLVYPPVEVSDYDQTELWYTQWLHFC